MNQVNPRKSHRRTISIILLLILSITFVAIYFGVGKHQEQRPKDIKIDGLVLNPPKTITDFELKTTNGKSFTKDNLKGQWTFLFFGFSNCGMVCPTTMANLNKMYQLMEKEIPATEMPRIIMVTVDPERDTLKRMENYVTSFNPNFQGAIGETAQLSSLQKQLHILAIKVQGKEGGKNNYYYDHSAEILLFNPDANVQAYFSYPHKPENMVKDYKSIVASVAKG